MAAAESPGPNTDWQKNITCRYFIHGVCRAGDNCRYAHDRSGKDANICRFYLSGNCRFGSSCRYDHVKPNSKSSSQRANKATALSSAHKGTTSVGTLEDAPSKMVKLRKGLASEAMREDQLSPLRKWRMEDLVGAAEFVPGQLYVGSVPPTYSAAAQSGVDSKDVSPGPSAVLHDGPQHAEDLLCPFALQGTCRYGENCKFLHGEVCDMCGSACLIINDPVQNKHHRELCLAAHEKSMQEAFAFQHSKDVQCCICMEVVLEKSPAKERKFGLLSNCNHPYCLSCIRKWRSAKQYEKKVVRACPICRIASPFVTPSDFWVDNAEEKKTVLEKYKEALSKKECKYFKQGSGTCPFGAECFYLHAYPDGTKEDRTKARQFSSGDGKLNTCRSLSLWDFFEERENRVMDWDSDDDDDWFLYYDWSDDFDFSDIEDHGLWSDYFEFFGSGESSDYSEDEEEDGDGIAAATVAMAASSMQGGATVSSDTDDEGETGSASDHTRLLQHASDQARPSKDCIYL
ncbi:probable E3 ubiquitin-protein ligase makorin-1 isoform X2 [Acanthaster planci]|uniref:RING-type E3 ubiquitin transferase n=1 Tax=Acanthaster planci TaxID=133434 RepID=A0A8B7XLX7_ACAPL|nr:probable E3 ubiquitin-protein ligase makorin-1 isoform X2 [Acanthaster planci]